MESDILVHLDYIFLTTLGKHKIGKFVRSEFLTAASKKMAVS